MKVPDRLRSAKEIHDKVNPETRFTHFVQEGDKFKRVLEVEISQVEAADKLKEMQTRLFLIRQLLNDGSRYLGNEKVRLNDFISLAKYNGYIKLYNLIQVDHEAGIKYIVQFKALGKIITFEIIEQGSKEEINKVAV